MYEQSSVFAIESHVPRPKTGSQKVLNKILLEAWMNWLMQSNWWGLTVQNETNIEQAFNQIDSWLIKKNHYLVISEKDAQSTEHVLSLRDMEYWKQKAKKEGWRKYDKKFRATCWLCLKALFISSHITASRSLKWQWRGEPGKGSQDDPGSNVKQLTEGLETHSGKSRGLVGD